MARIAGVDIPRNKRVEVSLTYIFGIGRSTSNKILEKAGVDKDIKVKDLTEEQVGKIRTIVEEYKIEGELRKEINGLEKTIKRYEKETNRAKKFIRLIERYDNFDELTPTIINEFVEKILVHERDRKGSQTANQKVEIYFNFIGNYEPPKEELSEEERLKLEDEERKNNERKDKLYQNYLKRKASGKQ